MANLQEIAAKLKCADSRCVCQKQPTNGNLLRHCPAHDDEHPSLSLKVERDKILWNCHAGCSHDEVLGALKKKGLWAGPERNGDHPKRRAGGQQTRYEVRDSEGHVVAIHVREDGPGGKRMWWERPDGSKGLAGLPTAALPLYGPETLPALADGAQVVVVEGEKAADVLRSLGIPAVGTVTGANGTPGSEALRPLARFRVFLWADYDDAGHQHMNRIAARLVAIGCQNIRLVDWHEAPPKGDAADAVTQGVDVRQLIANSAAWNPVHLDLAGLLDEAVTFIRQYVVLTDHQLWALALWTAHTYALEATECTPYLSVKSAEKQSGKTLLLEVLSLLVKCPWFTGRVTAAVLVRKMARDEPTLLLDESDAAFKGDKEYSETLRGVLNSGYRRGGVVSLCVKVGGDFDLRDFPVFGAKALAGIGKLPDTIQDRSIPIEMRRKARNEHVKRFRLQDAKVEAVSIKERLEKWAALAVPALERARPDIPDELDDRAADVWEPLLAIADMAGNEWPERAREATRALSTGSAREDDSLGVMLLRDIREVFEGQKADRISSVALVEALISIEESPWGDMWGRPLDVRRLAKMVRAYGIRPHVVRIGERTPSGYGISDFRDAWRRYLPFENPQQGQHPQRPFGTNTPDVEGVEDVEALRGIEQEVTEWTG